MKRIKGLVIATAIMLAMAPAANAKQGPVSIMSMHRIEAQSDVPLTSPTAPKTAAGFTSTDSATYAYNMLALNRQLNKQVVANVMYLHKYDFDSSRTAFHSGSLSLVRTFKSPHYRASFSYNYTNNPENVTDKTEQRDSDRFSLGFRYDFNPDSKGTNYSLRTTYGTNTNFSDGATLRLQPHMAVTFSEKWSGAFSYTYSYRLNDGPDPTTEAQQLTNQVQADLSYKLNDAHKLVIGALYIDNTATITNGVIYGELEDNLIGRISLFRMW